MTDGQGILAAIAGAAIFLAGLFLGMAVPSYEIDRVHILGVEKRINLVDGEKVLVQKYAAELVTQRIMKAREEAIDD